MDVGTAIANRRSVRKYKPEQLSKEDMSKILEAARLSPSARNDQARKLIVITDENIKSDMVAACKNQSFVKECAAVLVAVHSPEKRWSAEDCVIMLDHVTLQAEELGIGTCWIGAFEEDKVKAVAKIPADMRVALCMTVGYPNESPAARPRKDLDDIVCWEKYQ